MDRRVWTGLHGSVELGKVKLSMQRHGRQKLTAPTAPPSLQQQCLVAGFSWLTFGVFIGSKSRDSGPELNTAHRSDIYRARVGAPRCALLVEPLGAELAILVVRNH